MTSTPKNDIAGIIILRKPPGVGSARYVYRLRPIFKIRKVGHAGTLDPFADGVLLGCVGRATKMVERLIALPKQYRTSIRLGVTNDTYDTEKPFRPVTVAQAVSRAQVEQALLAFNGLVSQIPPAYSAVKIGGVPSYRLARRDVAVDIKPKTVRIDVIRILEYAWPQLTLDITCGRGTYIRAIARDLGEVLACGACCERLTRVAVGPFHVDDAIDIDQAGPDSIRAALRSIDDVARMLAHADASGAGDGFTGESSAAGPSSGVSSP